MKFKKMISAGLCAALIATTLAGCSAPASKPSSASVPGSTTAKGDRMTITVLGVDWGFGPLANSEMEQKWEELYDVDLDVQWVNYEEYAQKANALISTNTQPDVVQIYQINASYYYPIFTQAIDAGNFVDLNKYLTPDYIKGNATMSKWEQGMWDQASYNGGMFIMPRSKAEIAKESGISVRRDLMKKYGFEKEPKTMEELKTWLIDLSAAATKGEGHKIYALDFFDDKFMQDRVKAFAVAFTGQMDWGINKDGEFQYMQFADGYIDFLNWMKDLNDAGALDPEFALGNADTSKWKGGNSIAYLNAWYNFNQSADLTSQKIFDKSTPDTLEAWGLMPIQGPKGKAISPNAYDIDQAIAISSSCSEEKIQKILEVFNGTEQSQPGYDLLMSDGVEGVHYTVEADGTRAANETQDAKRTEGYVGAWNQIFLKIDADQIPGKFERAGTKASSEEVLGRAKAIKADIVDYLKTSGIKHENTNLQSETYSNNWGTLTADVDSNCALYIMGQLTEQQWNDFVKSIVESPDYKAIQKEFKDAKAAAKK